MALVAAADPAAAEPMAVYMRDQFTFLGVKTTPRRKAAKSVVSRVRRWDVVDLVAFVDECWSQAEREFQYVGVDLIVAEARRLDTSNLSDIRRWITTRSWWDTVDALASHAVGSIVQSNVECRIVMDTWIDDENIWIARSAILHQLRYATATDEDRLFAYVLRRAPDTDFFIRKASGWALRSYSRVAPDAVRKFVATHEVELSGLTRREAIRNLS